MMAAPHATPGRRRRDPDKENKYFEPGKLGRKTGIELKDTGVRDEFGFEPVSGIFSSPAIQPSVKRDPNNAQEPQTVLPLRKTPHLPPRSQTPRHTNIGGSPIRHSPTRPSSRAAHESPRRPLSESPKKTPNRLLDFSRSEIVRSVEKSPSPTKSKGAFGGRSGKQRKSIFQFNLSPEKKSTRSTRRRSDASNVSETAEEITKAIDMLEDVHEPLPAPVAVMMPEIDAQDDYIPPMEDDYTVPEADQDETTEPQSAEPIEGPNIKRKRGRPRKSDLSEDGPGNDSAISLQEDITEVHRTPRRVEGDEEIHSSPQKHSSGKRRRITVDLSTTVTENDTYTSEPVVDLTSPIRPSHVQSAGQLSATSSRFVRDMSSSSASAYSAGPEGSVEPEEYQPDIEASPEANRRRKSDGKATTRKARETDTRQQPTKRRTAKGTVRPAKAAAPSNSRSDGEDANGPTRRGPQSIVELRAGTPMEDEGVTMTRSGRASIKPLQYWKNEQFIWRHGEVEGVVRAQEVEQPKRKVIKRKTDGRLGSIVEGEEEKEEDEEVEAEDLLPELWEEELGVINGPVRPWDAEIQNGDMSQEVDEDIAFASKSIVVRDVQGSAFRYAKIMTMDFFGSGMVEIPPQGYKRSKNSRKNQMVFFVHEGKVTIDVAGMTFGLTKGGVWQVPRGNNYAIANESKSHPAKIFFAQASESGNGFEDGAYGAMA